MSEQAITLTSDDWDEVQDALGVVEAMALDDADAWRGRVREPRYRKEAATAKRVWDAIEAQRKTGARPTQETPE